MLWSKPENCNTLKCFAVLLKDFVVGKRCSGGTQRKLAFHIKTSCLQTVNCTLKKTMHVVSLCVHCITCYIGVGASKRLKVRRIFTQISPNLPPKHTSSTIFAQISPNLPEETKSKHDLQKNVCPLIFVAIIIKSKHTQRFCKGIHTFCPNFHRFCPDFH